MFDSKIKKLVVGVSDAKISSSPQDTIVTYSLGSCIGVCIYDSHKKAGGMLHFQLPESKLDPEKALARPFMFADTGIRLILQNMLALGCKKKYMSVKLAGGAAMRNGPANFDIGKRNHLAIRKCLWQAGLMIGSEDVGRDIPRSVYMELATGKITVKTPQGTKEI